jgi:hypothetical protein
VNRFAPRISVLLCASVLLAASSVAAQSNKGALNGTVVDPTGAVVGGASVIITNLSTNERLELKTSDSGTFAAPPRIPGSAKATCRA